MVKIKLKKMRIDQLYRMALTDINYRYWYLWTISNLGYMPSIPKNWKEDTPEIKKYLHQSWGWIESAEYELGEGSLSEEAEFCRKDAEEELNSGELQF